MKALNLNTAQGINRAHRKENNFDGEYMIVTADNLGISVKISCRLYSTKATNYCCIWISGTGEMLSGSGTAGGYGYNRMSAAVSGAIRSAGFKLDTSIAGVGESAVREALLAISETMGYINPTIIQSHP